MRKALCVGIDSYQNASDLHGCVNDANAVKSLLFTAVLCNGFGRQFLRGTSEQQIHE